MITQIRRPGGIVAFAVLLLAACSAPEDEVASVEPVSAAAAAAATAEVRLAGETFTVEVAADPRSRTRGLSGRASIPRNGGMLFVLPRPGPFTMVMRDCPNPIDVAFIDSMGRVVTIHAMAPELPRRNGETPFQYERRLPGYHSGEPVQFALETAGGRLAELGLAVGDRVHFDAQALVAGAR